MKILDIALKDLTRSMRSTFAVLFMFGVPLLVTGMFYFMFGNMSDDNGGFDLPVTTVVVANLDQGAPDMLMGSTLIGLEASQSLDNLGQTIIYFLKLDELQKYLVVTGADDAESARLAVDNDQADVALIIPADFSAKISGPELDSVSVLELYIDPEKSLGAGILQSILQQFLDTISGARIAAGVAARHIPPEEYSKLSHLIQSYTSDTLQGDSHKLVANQSVAEEKQANSVLIVVSSIMAGMMIFYAFYTGMTTAESILREDEEGTLPRLFSTPTSRTVILAGKYLAVLITVLVQVVVLIIAAKLIFKIDWGNPFNVGLIAFGTVLAASAFGVFANSLIKSTKQGGIVYGGFLTVTGMLGMIKIFTMSVPNTSPTMETISLLVPQGWAIRGFFQSASSMFSVEILITFGVLLLWTILFFCVGAWRFHRRFA